jgi:phenylalanyl-tRNA synthetase alpha chain
MLDYIKKIEQEAQAELANVKSAPEAEAFRVKYLSRNGIVAKILDQMKTLPPEQKPQAGRLANELKNKLTSEVKTRLESLGAGVSSEDKIDLTLPGLNYKLGGLHPLTKTIDEINQIFLGLGFSIVEGPEIETQHNNFEALNIPLDHPSCDAFDTFYLEGKDKLLLRSHTSQKEKTSSFCAATPRLFRSALWRKINRHFLLLSPAKFTAPTLQTLVILLCFTK